MSRFFNVTSVPVCLALVTAACADLTTESTEEDLEVVSIEISAEYEVIGVGETTQLTATGFNVRGQDVTNTAEFVWSSDPLEVLRVDQSGLATGVSEGQATVTATVNEVWATIEIEVGQPSAPGG